MRRDWPTHRWLPTAPGGLQVIEDKPGSKWWAEFRDGGDGILWMKRPSRLAIALRWIRGRL